MTDTRVTVRDERGTTTAEYTACTGAAIGLACVLFKFLTSGAGEALIRFIWNAVKAVLGF